MVHPAETEQMEATRVVIRLNAVMTGVVVGILAGLGLFLATVWLVLKGGPYPGAHLQLLANYFPGYSVTVVGSFVGFAYAFVVGLFFGTVLGWTYNKLAR